MLSKGDLIDWNEVEQELSDHMLRTRGTFSHEVTFWHSQGGFECFFTMIDGKMYRNIYFDIPVTLVELQARENSTTVKINWEALYVEFSAHMSQRPKDMGHSRWLVQFWDHRGGSKRYFDKGPFGETIRRVYLLDLPDKRIKIDWDELTKLWNEHWRTPPTLIVEVQEHRDTFWMKHGGFEAYFDNGPFGVPTRREYMREAGEPGMYEAPPKTHYWDGPENVIAD